MDRGFFMSPGNVGLVLTGGGARAAYQVGVLSKERFNLVSYVLFEKQYCRALLRLGYHDTMRVRADLGRFLGAVPAAA